MSDLFWRTAGKRMRLSLSIWCWREATRRKHVSCGKTITTSVVGFKSGFQCVIHWKWGTGVRNGICLRPHYDNIFLLISSHSSNFGLKFTSSESSSWHPSMVSSFTPLYSTQLSCWYNQTLCNYTFISAYLLLSISSTICDLTESRNCVYFLPKTYPVPG